MPITDLGSYATTGEEFKSHWTDVNADRVATGGTALVLVGGYSLTNLTTDVASIAAVITDEEDLENAIALATTTRDNQKATLRDRVIEFREAVEYRLKGSGYVRALPDTPHPNASEQKFLKALDDMGSLWVRIDAETGVPNFTPPLLLRGALARAGFQTELTTLRTNYNAVTEAENNARIGRGQRDVLLLPLRDRFVQYRQAILVEYGPVHPFTSSLPDVYPQPGSTPAAVTLSGAWNAATGQADFSWTQSSNPALLEFEIRRCLGATWNDATAIVIGNIPAGSPLAATPTNFSTSDGLDSSGDSVTIKVVVRLTTGNEAGSNAVTITRP